MANITDRQIIHEGYRNVLVKFTGTLDTGNVSIVPAISLQDMKDNDMGIGTLAGFRVDKIEWSISQGMEVLLEWNSVTPQQIAPIAGRGKIEATWYGGMQPDSTKNGYDGSINLKTTGFSVGTPYNYTVTMELIKLYVRP